MTVPEIIVILENRIINLTETRKQAVSSGLIDQVMSIDSDLTTTQMSLQLLYDSQKPAPQ